MLNKEVVEFKNVEFMLEELVDDYIKEEIKKEGKSLNKFCKNYVEYIHYNLSEDYIEEEEEAEDINEYITDFLYQ